MRNYNGLIPVKADDSVNLLFHPGAFRIASFEVEPLRLTCGSCGIRRRGQA